MSNLLEVMEPFQENMDRFINLYEQVNNILSSIQEPGFGFTVTRVQYYEAANEMDYTQQEAYELLNNDFVNISRILTEDRNKEGSIEYILYKLQEMYTGNQFTFLTNRALTTRFEKLKGLFVRSLLGLNENLKFFLENVDDGTNDSIFKAPGDVVSVEVRTAINNYNNFLSNFFCK